MKTGLIKISRFDEGLTVFKPDYYLNRGKRIISDLLDKNIENSLLSELSDNIYQGGIFKRIFNKEGEKSYKYVTASDMVKAHPLNTAKNISKKFTPWVEEMTLKSNQILVSCAGTVGNTALVNDSFSGCIGSQEIIRIENLKVPFGYIYAYLSTPLVHEYIQSMIYGAVVPRISPDELGNLPILLPTENKQQEINNLIVKASDLRVEANRFLSEVHSIFNEKLSFQSNKEIHSSKEANIIKYNYHKRLDSSYYININNPEDELSKGKYQSIELGKLVSRKMFTAQRGKRNYVGSNGIRFLSTTNISESNPLLIKKYLSRNTKGLDTLIVEKDWILVSSSGQDILGSAFLVDNSYSKCAVNQHSIRVIIDKEIISPYYVYGYLSTPKIKEYIRSGIYGSAVLTIDENFLKHLKVPILKDDIHSISKMVKRSSAKFEEACFLEKEAIDLVEKEIEKWQK
ncbi:restriction endonuclease subunit S [Flagellimonas pacifica]|uniref:Type I restriction enzyme, S subunit n=1 Tax=Flagellimonas pacifica TaxID=1247520 RepID=A0A285MID5_9FLAO|nr:restriction endonuclease subunit S [Allomuricauda parva]SNY95261.1 type I restriction enzyme, S subunit [Allomuricauda parva]